MLCEAGTAAKSVQWLDYTLITKIDLVRTSPRSAGGSSSNFNGSFISARNETRIVSPRSSELNLGTRLTVSYSVDAKRNLANNFFVTNESGSEREPPCNILF